MLVDEILTGAVRLFWVLLILWVLRVIRRQHVLDHPEERVNNGVTHAATNDNITLHHLHKPVFKIIARRSASELAAMGRRPDRCHLLGQVPCRAVSRSDRSRHIDFHGCADG